VGAATSPPVGAYVRAFSVMSDRTTESCQSPSYEQGSDHPRHHFSVASIVQPQLPQLMQSAARGPEDFRALEKKLQREVIVWTALLVIGAAIVMPLILPWLDRPQLQASLPVFWVVLAATVLRIGADSYGFALLAMHRDTAIAVISVAGVAASAALNAALIPAFGLIGAGYAFVLTAAGLFVARFWITRAQRPAPVGHRPEALARSK